MTDKNYTWMAWPLKIVSANNVTEQRKNYLSTVYLSAALKCIFEESNYSNATPGTPGTPGTPANAISHMT